MLFILVMDVLGFLITKAESVGLLQPLSMRVFQYRVSFYVDDVVLFLQPTMEGISITMYILYVFGEALGLWNNAQKSNIFSIWCGEEERELVQRLLPYPLSNFPCRYLGLPLSLQNIIRDQLRPIIDRIPDQLSGSKAELLTKPR
jgi:hypothetical protein